MKGDSGVNERITMRSQTCFLGVRRLYLDYCAARSKVTPGVMELAGDTLPPPQHTV